MSKVTKLIKHPVKFFEDAAKKKKELAKVANVENPIFAFRVNDWKRPLLESWMSGKTLIYVPFKTSDVELEKKWLPLINNTPNAEVLVWGHNLPVPMKNTIKPIRYVEDGFIRSVGLGANHTPPMSLCFDSKAPYFDATVETDLEKLLSSYDFDNDKELSRRAAELKNKIIKNDISKYNHNNEKLLSKSLSDKPKILVVGQVEDDASIIYGCKQKISNNDLVNIAALENPEAEILYKPHPDVIAKKREMLSNPKEVEDIATVIYEDISICSLLGENIQRVYTITSQVGLEALIRGISVTTLGCPFYAGWGVTDDRQENIRRDRKLTVDQIFSAAYILYPQYFDPYRKIQVEVEEVIDLIVSKLKKKASISSVANDEKNKNRKVIKVEQLSARIEKGGPKAFLFGFGLQKVTFFVRQLQNHFNVYSLNMPVSQQVALTASQIISAFGAVEGDRVVIWGRKDPDGLEGKLRELGISVHRIEDAFIRSVGLGGLQPIPLSYIDDDSGIYFDATKESRLEKILNEYDFDSNPRLMERSRGMIRDMIEKGTSKYNFNHAVDIEKYYGVKSKKRILVIGQVEDDASIVFGCSRQITNNDLVYLAKFENPEAQIIYKPHPDVLSGLRKRLSDPSVVEDVADVLYDQVSLSDSFETIDHVYTITSLSGFEALLRGIKVTTVGAPFYSGWGLTDDRQLVDRRKRKLSVEEVFAAAYILYPIYVNPFTLQKSTPEESLKLLDWIKAKNIQPTPSPSLMGNSQSHIKKIESLMASGKYADALVLANFAVAAYSDFDSYLARAKVRVSSGDVGPKAESDFHYACEITEWKNKKCLLAYAKFLWEFRGYNKELHAVLAKLKSLAGLSNSDRNAMAAMYADGGYFDSMLSSFPSGKNNSFITGYLYLSYVLSGTVKPSNQSDFVVDQIYENVIKSVREFEKYVKQNRSNFCLVGNSPCELGSENGQVIDSFECVIRFNDFNVDFPYSQDYGTKTSIWVRMPKNMGLSEKNIDNVIISGSNWISRLPDGVETFNLFQRFHKSVAVVPSEVYKRLSTELGSAPSAGLQILYWIYTLIGPISHKQVYGFSMIDQQVGKNSHYASKKSVSVRHNWIAERKVLDSIVE
ncbi:glycosyltransferase family 29 protein [Salinicola salarius]|uniref:glycosyltransferase family 29 protein n=1 Tax=Salinicola salarius TaxID=430457 RepID=UPI000DA22520|nr:glycosyltransferase family 29 protein [Salinicola salarius]